MSNLNGATYSMQIETKLALIVHLLSNTLTTTVVVKLSLRVGNVLCIGGNVELSRADGVSGALSLSRFAKERLRFDKRIE